MLRNSTFYIFLILLLSTVSGPKLYAQSACDESIVLPEAEKKYATGNFDEVLESLRSCINNGFNEDGKVQAYKILVKTYLAIDSVESARNAITRILEINPDFEPDFSASEQFKVLVTEMKALQEQIIQITSVSKKLENLLLVPATVMVITEAEIRQRGYQSLEQMLHDLPGFDIAKGNGPGYSYFYQRGYRSISNDRTLLLVDGVEENDLVSNNIPISRQYPIADIERVEVIYGPASTLYGANAFSGVINVITKSHKASTGTNRRLEFSGQARNGTWNTRYADGVLTAKGRDLAVTVTGRYFRSDEMDLSRFATWNYDARTPDQYTGLLGIQGTNAEGEFLAQRYLNTSNLLTKFPNSDLFEIDYTGGQASAIRLSEAGRQRAASLDNEFVFNGRIGNERVTYDNVSQDWFARVKVEFKEFTISAYSWRTDEGATPWYTNRSRLSAPNYSRWITANNALATTYTKALSDKFQVLNITSFKIHEIAGNTNLAFYSGYYNRQYNLLDLANNRKPTTGTQYLYRYSNQLRNELRLFYTPSPKLDISSGIEIRGSYIQGDYIRSTSEFPDEGGYFTDSIPGGNSYRSYDLGLYSQVTYNPRSYLKLVGGLRMDNNRIRLNGGYGTVFNPRLASILTRGKFIYKIIYAQAFKDASNLQKYGTTNDRRLNNPTLQPEQVQNIEASVNWRVSKELSFSAVAYQSNYSNVIGTRRVAYGRNNIDSTNQFTPIGKQQIWGIQGEGSYKTDRLSLWGNFTVTNPKDLENGLRISDIAEFMFNMGGNYQPTRKITINLSANYVGARRTGAGTSGSNNPITRFDPYLIFDTALTYNDALKGVSVQLLVNNITNTQYFVPGIREADGTTFASRFPQERRYISLGLLFNFQ
jgi:outer membrane receptor for ferrienterochelin and colicins